MTDATAELNTVSWGDPDAENTALLVHGLTGRADAFRALVEELEAEGLTGWRFLAVDLRGRGATGRVEGSAGIPAHAADLVALLDRKGLDREKMRGLRLSELWPRIGCPTLVLLSRVGLAGPDEGFILPPQDARRMQVTIPGCTLFEVEDTNHYDILYTPPRGPPSRR